MPRQEQLAPQRARATHSDAQTFLPGTGSATIQWQQKSDQRSFARRILALLRRSARKPMVVGAIAIAVPVLIGKVRSARSNTTPHQLKPHQDGVIAWISAGWNAFVLFHHLRGSNFGPRAARQTRSPAKSLEQPSIQKIDPATSPAAVARRVSLKSVYTLLKVSVSNWIDDFAPSMGAALSYYTVFSIAPLLVIAIAVAALVFGQSTAQAEILDQIRGLLGPEGANAIESMLASAQKPKEGALSSVLSVVMLLIGATTVFSELESDLNRIWRVPASKQSGIWRLLRTRVLSLGLVLTIGFLLLVSLVASAALAAWGKYWSGWFFGVEVALQAANFVLSLAVFTVLFALMYKILPRVKLTWRDVWVGAAVTSALFAVGKFLIGLYIGKTSVASSYGAAGALVVLLVWVYYSSQVFLLGAEFTRAYAQSHGSRRPNPKTGQSPALSRI
jgi:membrane protein